MAIATILWVDDELESLKSQILFLEQKGYAVHGLSNGFDAIDFIQQQPVDVVLMDESMPGLSGLETLAKMKEWNANLPVVLITKNETENLMNEAIGKQIADYLIKPVNPNQVLLSLKKIIDNRRLVSEQTTIAYQQQFRHLFMALNSSPNHKEWMDIYKKLVYWELEMQKTNSPAMQEVLADQKSEANTEFCKFIAKSYVSWMQSPNGRPILSHELLAAKVLPYLQANQPLYFVLIDNLRFDQWKAIQPLITESYRIEEEDSYYSILPTATPYSRNAIFAGLLPVEIKEKYPNAWMWEEEAGSKNQHEEMLLKEQLHRLGKSHLKVSFTKVAQYQHGQDLVNNIHNLQHNDLNVIVYNFVDMLSHARTEMEIMKELAGDENSYRSLTASWFEHSPLHQALKKLSEKQARVVLSTDHGSIRVHQAVKVVGDKSTTANLRYKHGRGIGYEDKTVFAIRQPSAAGLPNAAINSVYVFAKKDDFLCYPNNFGTYSNYYSNTFQHGGVSLEEMIIPVIRLSGKGS